MSTTTNTPRRFYDISTFTLASGGNSVVYNTIKSVSIDQKAKKVADAGDHDAYETFVARGLHETSITIDMADPIQAAALREASGTLTFLGKAQAGGTDELVTVDGFLGLGGGSKNEYNKPTDNSVMATAVSSDGATNPVTYAPAS